MAKRRTIALFARYVDGIFAVNPDLLRVLPPGPLCALRQCRSSPVAARRPFGTGVPKVLHAPSHRGVKGTRFVIDAVERLEVRGVPFEFRLVEGLRRRGGPRPVRRRRSAGRPAPGRVVRRPLGRVDGHGDSGGLLSPNRRSPLPSPGDAGRAPVIGADPGTVTSVLRDLLTTRRGELPSSAAAAAPLWSGGTIRSGSQRNYATHISRQWPPPTTARIGSPPPAPFALGVRPRSGPGDGCAHDFPGIAVRPWPIEIGDARWAPHPVGLADGRRRWGSSGPTG